MNRYKSLEFYCKLFWIVSLFFITHEVNTQELEKFNDPINEIIAVSEDFLGADDELVNGKIYYQNNLNAQGHPFYLSNEWLPSELMINGKSHDNQQLKYDIENDEVAAIIQQKGGATYVITLNKNYLDEFTLANHLFINNKHLNIKEAKKHFLEQIYSGNFSFYANHTKLFVRQYNNKTPYGKYAKTSSAYFLIDKNVTYRISSKKVLLRHFESHKKEINKYMKVNKIKFNKASVEQLKMLMQYSDELINNR